jgi:hypothetical protein
MAAKKAQSGMRKSTADPHPLFGGNPAQYTDDVAHRPEDEDEPDTATPAAMAQQGRWTRK